MLAPTRELALQVSSHLNACLNSFSENTVVDVNREDADGNPVLSQSQSKKRKEKGKNKEIVPVQSKPKGPPLVSVAAIVGGMSSQKQRRILDRGVDVLVATPGRLWDIIQEVIHLCHTLQLWNSMFTRSIQDDDLAIQIRALRFLVLDEADRMIETGHFAELDNILRLTLRLATCVRPYRIVSILTCLQRGGNRTSVVRR